MNARQVVQVQILGAQRKYTYEYNFNPVTQRALRIGDKVEIPGNMVTEDGGSATVVALGSDYNGPMKAIVRLIPPPAAPVDDLWAGEEFF